MAKKHVRWIHGDIPTASFCRKLRHRIRVLLHNTRRVSSTINREDRGWAVRSERGTRSVVNHVHGPISSLAMALQKRPTQTMISSSRSRDGSWGQTESAFQCHGSRAWLTCPCHQSLSSSRPAAASRGPPNHSDTSIDRSGPPSEAFTQASSFHSGQPVRQMRSR